MIDYNKIIKEWDSLEAFVVDCLGYTVDELGALSQFELKGIIGNEISANDELYKAYIIL